MMREAVLAIDIGGSKLVTGLVGKDGAVLCKEKSSWDKLDSDSVVNKILKSASRILDSNKDVKVSFAGVNIPGLADKEKGLWIEACFSGIQNVPIAKIISEYLNIPVFIDNDANNCALAEKMFGACRDCTDFIWLTVSNGCGAALFLNGQLYGGVRGTAGELGHICVEEQGGYSCGCGNFGCLEAQAAGPGIIKRYLDAGGDITKANAEYIAGLARLGDPLALMVYKKEGYYIGKALSSAINAINPQKVVIGGGVAGAFDLFYPELAVTVKKMTYRKASGHVSIEKTGLGYDAALVGAAALAIMRT